MPRLYRRNQLLHRLYFLLVIAAGAAGWLFGARFWQPDPSAFELNALTGGADWSDLVAGAIEDAIQIFQDLTSQAPRG